MLYKGTLRLSERQDGLDPTAPVVTAYEFVEVRHLSHRVACMQLVR